MSLNKVLVIGHLGQDPEIRYSQLACQLLTFRLQLTSPIWTRRVNVKIGRSGIGLSLSGSSR